MFSHQIISKNWTEACNVQFQFHVKENNALAVDESRASHAPLQFPDHLDWNTLLGFTIDTLDTYRFPHNTLYIFIFTLIRLHFSNPSSLLACWEGDEAWGSCWQGGQSKMQPLWEMFMGRDVHRRCWYRRDNKKTETTCGHRIFWNKFLPTAQQSWAQKAKNSVNAWRPMRRRLCIYVKGGFVQVSTKMHFLIPYCGAADSSTAELEDIVG